MVYHIRRPFVNHVIARPSLLDHLDGLLPSSTSSKTSWIRAVLSGPGALCWKWDIWNAGRNNTHMSTTLLADAIGQQVSWTSQAGGYSATKTGRLLALVPPEAHIENIARDLGLTFGRSDRRFDNWQSQNERALVAVTTGTAKKRTIYYAPLVSKLRLSGPPAAQQSVDSYAIDRVRHYLAAQGPEGAEALRLLELLAEAQACAPITREQRTRLWAAVVNTHGGVGDGEAAADALLADLIHVVSRRQV